MVLVLASSAVAAEQSSKKLLPPASDPGRQHLQTGLELERIGLHEEAKAEYLASLAVAGPATKPKIVLALKRLLQAQRSADSAEADQRSHRYLQFGEVLQKEGQYNEALEAFRRAYNEADGEEARAHAQDAVAGVLAEKDSFWKRFYEVWLVPGAQVVCLMIMLYLLYLIVGGIGRFLSRFSRRIVVADFEDTTDTGFGKGFPALLKVLYRERQQLARHGLAATGSGIVTYRTEPEAQPIMGSRRYENFSEIELNIAGLAVSEVLRNIFRMLFRPYYSVSGVVYRYNNESRAVATLAKHDRILEHWDFTLSDGQPAGPVPSDSAHQVVDAIIRDWEQQ